MYKKVGRSHCHRSAALAPGVKISSRSRTTVCNLCLAWCAFSTERMQGDNGSRDSQSSYRSVTERAIHSQFLIGVVPFLKFIRNARNCVEHPKDSQRIVTRDFFPQADGTILPPTIQIIHPDTSMRATAVS